MPCVTSGILTGRDVPLCSPKKTNLHTCELSASISSGTGLHQSKVGGDILELLEGVVVGSSCLRHLVGFSRGIGWLCSYRVGDGVSWVAQ